MSTSRKRSTEPARSGRPARLSLRELTRATLARQLLLERHRITPLAAIERLAGMQAQVPRPPFIGLWTRVHGFTRPQLHRLVTGKRAVRATMMRGTIHLVSARDYLAWRPALHPFLSTTMRAILGKRIDGLDLRAVAAHARGGLPATFDKLRAHLVAAFPAFDDRALGYALRLSLPLVLVPTTTRWSYPGNADFDDAAAWLEAPIPADAPLDALVRRYLAAFGPATVRDAQAWAGARDLAPVFERLRPALVTFRDPDDRELFDLPAAPRPPADTPAPIRFLPEYDNLMLAYADRRRVIDDAHRRAMATKNGIVPATFLVDGRVAGLWTVERAKARATLHLRPLLTLPRPTKAAIEAEGEALLRWIEDDATTFALRWSR